MADDLVTYMGAVGNLLPFKCPTPGISAGRARASVVDITLDGIAKVQLGKVGMRTYEWDISAAEPEEVDNLIALYHGAYGDPPFFWYDPIAAKINMLTPDASIARLDGNSKWTKSGAGSLSVGGAMVLPDGSSAPESIQLNGLSTNAASPGIALPPDAHERTFSARIAINTSVAQTINVSMQAFGIAPGGGAFNTIIDTVASNATGARWVTLGPVSVPEGAWVMNLIVGSTAVGTGTVKFGRARVAESDVVLDKWLVGRGIPAVAILSIPELYQEGWDKTKSDYSVLLQEVL